MRVNEDDKKTAKTLYEEYLKCSHEDLATWQAAAAFEAIERRNKENTREPISLRDRFAISIIGGLIGNSNLNKHQSALFAEAAYSVADDMLKERLK